MRPLLVELKAQESVKPVRVVSTWLAAKIVGHLKLKNPSVF
jgi:hypothetical protein